MNKSSFYRKRLTAVALAVLLTCHAQAEGLTVNFQEADINEFINTVSKNLSKTIIIDPAVKGKISVRSYDELDNQQYYQFFLSVLEVYGFAVIEMNDAIVKVIPAKNAKSSGVPFRSGKPVRAGDELVTRVVQLQYVTAKELAPLLRQLNDSASGSVVHYDPSNMLLMTGRAAVITQLMAIVESVDIPADRTIEKVQLQNASAVQVAEILTDLAGKSGSTAATKLIKVVADPRTNTLLITGEANARQEMKEAAGKLDARGQQRSNSRVFYLQHAKAENLLEVLTGISSNLQDKTEGKGPAMTMMKNIVVKADTYTNSLVVNAPPDKMDELAEIISRLDISRSQVLVEAIIVEVLDADGLALGVQWFNKFGGGAQFNDTGVPVSDLTTGGMEGALSKFNGLAAGFYRGNWAGLFTALQNNSQNNILATPSIVTLDNMEAEFTVGQDVPILTGSQTTTGDNVFNTVDRKSVGIKLKVKPQINRGDSVMMEIEQEVSSVAEQSTKNDLGATFNTRTVRNAVVVGSGHTVVVGGLLDASSSNNQSSVPLLGRIPLIGSLFRSSAEKSSKRNLMLFIRPTIIRQQDNFDHASDKKLNQFRADMAKDSREKTPGESLDRLLEEKKTNNALRNIQQQINDFYHTEPGR
ncbi:type II secretion system secretin GspD [Pseudomonas cerasi]